MSGMIARMKNLFRIFLVVLFFASRIFADEARPLFRNFVGLCGHTVTFKPDLYAPVCRVVRDYHPVRWDLEGDTAKLPDWPEARNRVSWEQVYGSWSRAGLRSDVCLQFDEMTNDWKDIAHDARAYAESFAKNFGPGGRWPFVDSIEIGNEPGLFDDATYMKLFEAMARGIRAASPRMKIVTCNVESEKSDRYWKGANLFTNSLELFDVLQIHRYAIAEQWPVWRRTYPENPKVPFLGNVQKLLDWRDANARGKQVWVTEFGWDCSTKKPDPKGEWAKWVGSTDEEQARYVVRSFFLFAGMGVEKAFVYFFNDKDEPKLHACSGLTRNYQPKPAFHAVAWMLRSLADYRFSRAIRQSLDDGYVYEFTPEKSGLPVIWAVWHATKNDFPVTLDLRGASFERAERMPLMKDAVERFVPEKVGSEMLINAGENPVLIWIKQGP